MKLTRAALLLAVAAAIAAFFVFDLGRFLSLEFLAAQREAVAAFEEANPLLAAAFFLLYVAVAALPGAALLTLAVTPIRARTFYWVSQAEEGAVEARGTHCDCPYPGRRRPTAPP